MRDIAKLNENDKKSLFHNTAAKMGMTDAIIEKILGVQYARLSFHRCAWKIILLSRAAQAFQSHTA